MTDCYIYDAVRTPRGKGKKDGGLHEVTPVELTSEALRHILSLVKKPLNNSPNRYTTDQ